MENDDDKRKVGGTGANGTMEREERITGSVGVKNRKGEVIHPGSTTSPKGGRGLGEPDQGKVEESPEPSGGTRPLVPYPSNTASGPGGLGAIPMQNQGKDNKKSGQTGGNEQNFGREKENMQGQGHLGGQQNVGGRQQGGVQGNLQGGQQQGGQRGGNIGQQGNKPQGQQGGQNLGQGSRTGGQSNREEEEE